MDGEVALHKAALAHALSRVQEGPAFPLTHHHLLLSCFLICVMLMNWGLDYNTLITGLTKRLFVPLSTLATLIQASLSMSGSFSNELRRGGS